MFSRSEDRCDRPRSVAIVWCQKTKLTAHASLQNMGIPGIRNRSLHFYSQVSWQLMPLSSENASCGLSNLVWYEQPDRVKYLIKPSLRNEWFKFSKTWRSWTAHWWGGVTVSAILRLLPLFYLPDIDLPWPQYNPLYVSFTPPSRRSLHTD